MLQQHIPQRHIAQKASQHNWHDLVELFNQTFQVSHRTVLVKGDDEPVYLPADSEHSHHRIIFAHGFFASGLHEISHWCIAGPQRLLLEDFGYWYEPDGRTAEQQAIFEKVEIKPQALEWIFAKSCGFRFRVSTDNLNGEWTDNSQFKQNVYEQVGEYLAQGVDGLPDRPKSLVKALCSFYGTSMPLYSDFAIEELG